jgi:SUMO ligase MMS21 Smc5/6 complex component|tara:strand:- start:6 stop:458 length:453 start_codon:yes stop_codon:yes gene_type:complete
MKFNNKSTTQLLDQEFYAVMKHTEFFYESYGCTQWSFDELKLEIESNNSELSQILIKQLKEKLNCEYLIFTKLLTEEQIKNYHEAARNGIEYDDGNEIVRVLDLPSYIDQNEYMDGPRFGPFKTFDELEDFILTKKTIEFNNEKIKKHLS